MTVKDKTKKKSNELNLETLLTHFQKTHPTAAIQTETHQILITIKVEKVEFPLFIRMTEDHDLLQLLSFFPCNIKAGSEPDTARCLHLLNKELDIPGFGMDDLNGLIFYRCMIPCPDNQFNQVVVDKFFAAVQSICKSFFPLIFAVSQGNLKFADIADKLSEMMQASGQV